MKKVLWLGLLLISGCSSTPPVEQVVAVQPTSTPVAVAVPPSPSVVMAPIPNQVISNNPQRPKTLRRASAPVRVIRRPSPSTYPAQSTYVPPSRPLNSDEKLAIAGNQVIQDLATRIQNADSRQDLDRLALEVRLTGYDVEYLAQKERQAGRMQGFSDKGLRLKLTYLGTAIHMKKMGLIGESNMYLGIATGDNQSLMRHREIGRRTVQNSTRMLYENAVPRR